MNAQAYIGRFAPSPTGPLHPGSLCAALGSWLDARQQGGVWLVRIEDLDPPREVEGAAELQLGMLAALGLHSDAPVMRQSQRAAAYQHALDALCAKGEAFACSCTRTDLEAHGGLHRACDRALDPGHQAWRLRVTGTTLAFVDRRCGPIDTSPCDAFGDFVIRRADGPYAYQLAVVVDDADQGITDVVRGEDLLDSTPRQILLQRALGLPTPRYLHLPLVRDESGQKLSKSDGAHALDPDRPLDVLRAAWQALGQSMGAVCEATSVADFLQSAVKAFRVDELPAYGADLRSRATGV